MDEIPFVLVSCDLQGFKFTEKYLVQAFCTDLTLQKYKLLMNFKLVN